MDTKSIIPQKVVDGIEDEIDFLQEQSDVDKRCHGLKGMPLTGLVEEPAGGKFTFNPKEGIDNPVMVIADCTEEWETYGFHLRMERGRLGHIIRNVVSGGEAWRGGLQDGDRLLEVNKCYVDDIPHPEVARKIRLSGHRLCLLVLSEEEYEHAAAGGQDLRWCAKEHSVGDCKPPRLCHITRDPVSGLGINFTPVEGEKGHFAVSLVTGGPAEQAGVQKGDRLVWIDGAEVSNLTHSALSRMLKKCGSHVTVLVIDSESERKHTWQKMPILPVMAVQHNLPYRARKFHLDGGPQGYGFFLCQERAPSGRIANVLRKVGVGSPAERAGVRDGDVLLEVNGVSVEALNHEDIVERMRESGRFLTLSAITLQGLEFYTKLCLPPLLFCENGEEDGSRKQALCTLES